MIKNNIVFFSFLVQTLSLGGHKNPPSGLWPWEGWKRKPKLHFYLGFLRGLPLLWPCNPGMVFFWTKLWDYFSFFWHIPLFECVVANMIGVFGCCYFILLLWIELFKMCFLILIFLQEQTHTPYCYLDLHSSRSLKNHHQGELNQIFFLCISSNSFFVSPPISVMVSSWT